MDAVRADAAIYVLIAVYMVVGCSFVLSQGNMLFGDFDVYAAGCFAICCFVLPYSVAIFAIARITIRLKERRHLAYRRLVAPQRVARLVAGTMLALVLLLPFQEMFSSIKSAISSGAFGYDKATADLDRFIHFGKAPVKYMLDVAKNEWVLRVLEFNYHGIWFFVWFGVLYWICVSTRADAVRVRYGLTFCLVWIIIGNVVAGLFPTAGPAFYDLATGDANRFAKLHAFLYSGTSATADSQKYLWTMHLNGATGFGSGISAFPSMHVALMALNALFLAEFGKKVAFIAWSYVVVIMVSSVYLGWHYAIDGYVAVLLTTGIYWTLRLGMPALAKRFRAPKRRRRSSPPCWISPLTRRYP